MPLPLPYIQHGRIFFVPVIQQRLSFAVLVSRAFRELEQAAQFHPSKDAIAVELPESVRRPLDTPLSRLDGAVGSGKNRGHVSLLYSRTPGKDHREVLPVTPCDGIIEALRSARERRLRVEFIDREIAPGHLEVRTCVEDPLWPDDELAVVKGPIWFLDQVQPLLSHPPLRSEPMDTWREAFMAEHLRRLAASHERVLFVCQATHVNPIRSRLRKPAEDLRAMQAEPKPEIDVERADPSPALKLHYLDDMPRLVEVFDRSRSEGTAGEFTKRRAVVQAILDLRDDNIRHSHYSIRHYGSFLAMMQRLAMAEGRHSLRPEQIIDLAAACFDDRFAEQIRRHLMGYYDEIEVDRVGVLKEGPDPEEAGETGPRRVFSRGCNPFGRWYDLTILPVLLGSSDEEDILTWPAYKKFIAGMHRKAFTLQSALQTRRSSSKFQGSIQGGIDVRRTLKSYLGSEPTFYVKHIRRPRQQQQRRGDTLDPVVWLFELNSCFQENWSHYALRVATSLDDSSGYTCSWKCGEKVEDLHLIEVGGRLIRITSQWLLGAVEFCQAGLTIEHLEEIYGDEIKTRVPRFRTVDETLRELDPQLKRDANWHEILLKGALAFAKYGIIVVCSTGFVISETIRKLSKESGKEIHRVPLSKYTPEEQRKMRNDVTMRGRFGIPKGMDRNHPDVIRMLEQFRHIMRAYW